jgi:hypothetical protein
MKKPLSKNAANNRLERYLINEPSKAVILKFAQQCRDSGLINAGDLSEIQRLKSDRDMGAIDLLSEIRDSLNM